MIIDYHGPSQVRSIRIPYSLWELIKKFHTENGTRAWHSLSDTIRLLITAGLEHLEKKKEPKCVKKKHRPSSL